MNAAKAAYANSSAYVDFVNTISSDFSYTGQFGATNSMVEGSFNEDFANEPGDVGGNRSYNHFYDPLDTTYGKGLSDDTGQIFEVKFVG
jgi:hypothetical protein